MKKKRIIALIIAGILSCSFPVSAKDINEMTLEELKVAYLELQLEYEKLKASISDGEEDTDAETYNGEEAPYSEAIDFAVILKDALYNPNSFDIYHVYSKERKYENYYLFDYSGTNKLGGVVRDKYLAVYKKGELYTCYDGDDLEIYDGDKEGRRIYKEYFENKNAEYEELDVDFIKEKVEDM